ncbi:MAG: chemotaxis protein CheC [Candidatus Loosdrechtia sp.]|uniref:chemotaxis protein CheC n=1 Tax=Candidatus Loosdrechtia sp. TaxID=3101272 RepID=UPI003A63C7A4|nr:MAG: chemotaxis protein CheC [Candidatus Jettenia sp. AMX2]
MQITAEHQKMLDIIVKIGVDNASRTFSKTIKHAVVIQLAKTEVVGISEITEEMNKDLREMVASLLRLEGTFKGKLLFMIPLDSALVLQDLYIGSLPGTSASFDEYTEATVQEIGNILASSIGNSLASDIGSTLLPTPPLVMCDFAGTIFTSLIFEDGIDNDSLLLTRARFKLHNTEIDCYFFLLPDLPTIKETLNKLEKS